MRYVLVGLALFGALYCLHRIAVWAERRGWVYYLNKHGSSSALGNAFLEVQAIIEPSAKYVLEERTKDDLDTGESGDPPDPGKSGAVQPASGRRFAPPLSADVADEKGPGEAPTHTVWARRAPMTDVQRIEEHIRKLSPQEFAELRDWILEQDWGGVGRAD
jgi:hypothetical protein